MAQFSIAKEYTKSYEGGFWNDPSAGWTYAGITRNYYPAWPGFRRLLQLKEAKYKNTEIPRYTIFKDAELNKHVDDFYKATHWNKYIKGDSINTQAISNFIYDFVVHKENDAIKVINDVALTLDKNTATKAAEISSGVISVINRWPAQFYTLLYNARLNYYKNSKKFSSAYKTAFAKRVARFPKTLTIIN